MKKLKLLLLTTLFLGAAVSVIAQTKPGPQFYFPFNVTNELTKTTLPTGIYTTDLNHIFQGMASDGEKKLDIHEKRTPKSPIILGVAFSTGVQWDIRQLPVNIRSVSKQFSAFIIRENPTVTVIAFGITKANVGQYRYRVVENDSAEIVKWSKIKLEQKYGAKQSYGFIGKFKAQNKQLMVEVVNINNYSIRDGMVFDGREKLTPEVSQILVSKPPVRRYGAYDKAHPWVSGITSKRFNGGIATKFDPKTNLPLDLKFNADNIETLQIYFKPHQTVPYIIRLIRKVGAKSDTMRMASDFTNEVFLLHDELYKQPGKYELLIQPRHWVGLDKLQRLSIMFEVMPPPLGEKK